MLPSVDSSARRRWMGALARAPLAMLEAWRERERVPPITWLRRPETGLVMVRARAGGTGGKFNLGEMTVTRCALRLQGAALVGVAYVQGRSHRQAELAALADALLQGPEQARIERELLGPILARLEGEASGMRRKAQATRVEFFTVARQAGA